MKRVAVAAAVLWNESGSVLLGQRAPDTFYPGYWEFPGGKIEAGETPREALIRELREELGLELTAARIAPWLCRRHRYAHADVTLHFFQVWGWRGTPQPHVHAVLTWQTPGAWSVAPMLPANTPVAEALVLPRLMVVSQVTAASRGAPVGSPAWHDAAARWAASIRAARAHGAVIAQIREKRPDPGAEAGDNAAAEWSRLGIAQLVAIAREAGAERVVVNGPPEWADAVGADGCHLSAQAARTLLARGAKRPVLRYGLLLGVSVHDASERAVAEALNADYWVVGPVAATQSHPERAPLGWSRFSALIAAPPVPVFAIGGLTAAELPHALSAGAHGIAAIRGWLHGQ
ncbi:Nudix family hydrolase [Hydrogenophilus hirschii]